MKETEKNLHELEKIIYDVKMCCDYDYHNNKYQRIRDIGNLFGEADEDYFKSIKTKSDFSGNYIEYESKGEKGKNLSSKGYLGMMRPYLRDMVNDHKTRREWKIQLKMSINFISSKDSEETGIMYTKSHNIEIMIGNETDEIIEKLFESLLQNYQKDLEESMTESDFVFDCIDLLYFHLPKVGLKRDESYIDSPEWLKNKKATINPKNNDNISFHYALTVALNHQNIEKNPQRISKIKPFIDQYHWKERDFPSHSKDWKKFEQNNETITLKILFSPRNTEKIRLAYKSKHNFKRENQVILLMITDSKKWHILL